MALSKPIVSRVTPIDKIYGGEVYFTTLDYTIRSQTITIYNSATQEIIWSNTINVNLKNHMTIPANLQDVVYEGEVIGDKWDYGNKYALTITIEAYDSDIGEYANVMSDKTYFWVYSTPEFRFINIHDGQLFKTSNINADLYYHQAENETLDYYVFTLYDENKKEIQTDSYLTNVFDGHFYYSLSGLENNKSFYISAKGTTIEGTVLDTGLINFDVSYTTVYDGNYLELESDANGTVHGKTNIIIIEPEGNPDDYTIENSCVELLDKSLTYDNGYDVENNYTLSLKMTHVVTRTTNPETIVSMHNSSHNLVLTSYIYDDGTLRYHLKVNNGLCDSNYYSDPLELTDNDIVTVHIRRIDDMYQLTAIKLALL